MKIFFQRSSDLNVWRLPEGANIRREIGADVQSDAFSAVFDERTVFFDVYHSGMTGNIELLSPPLLNLRDHIRGFRLEGRLVQPGKVNLVRLERHQIKPEGAAFPMNLEVELDGQTQSFAISQETADFRDRKVLLTMFRYEPACWVLDWLKFHVANHDIDAALVYCNYVPSDELSALLEGVRTIDGLEQFVAVEWNFPYGPVDRDVVPEPWNYAYCKAAMFEHARTRYLWNAFGVLNLDVDEFAVEEQGAPIFDVMARSDFDTITMQQRMISGDDSQLSTAVRDRRHRHFTRFMRPGGPDAANSKWAILPQRGGRRVQWLTHMVKGARSLGAFENCWVAHFAPINMGWKADGRARQRALGEESAALAGAFRRAGWSDPS